MEAGSRRTGPVRPLLLGVDGGGTHTRAMVADASGRVLGRGEAGGSNQATLGSGAAGGGLAAAVRAALAEAGLRPADVDAACFGLAGYDRPQDEAAFRPAMDALGLGGPADLVNDAVIGWAGATGGEPGIAINAGTGSVGYGRSADGREARGGGWGAPFGDEGSAYWIGCEAIRRVLRGLDGRQPPSALAGPLASAAGVEDPADLCLLSRADRAAAGTPVETAIAALAPAVVACAEAGDPDAAAILDRAAEELVQLALGIAAAIGAAGAPPPVYGLGSVLLPRAADAPDTAVARRVDRLLRARVGDGLHRPAHPALVGALVLAWRRARAGEPLPTGLAAKWSAGALPGAPSGGAPAGSA